MLIILIILTILAFIVLAKLIWFLIFFKINDFSVPSSSIGNLAKRFKKVLVVFPHADDEGLSAGGLMANLSKNGVEVAWAIMTKGERGNPTASYDESLKAIRVKEAQKAAIPYGVKKLIQREYPDNGVDEHKIEMTTDIKKIIEDLKPELIITYDLSGLYGHPDHITVAEVVTDLVKSTFSNIELWYVSFPRKVIERIPLPVHMAKDKNFKDKREDPTTKVWVGFGSLINKIKAVEAYQSQRQSFSGGPMLKIIPSWFFTTFMLFEYFHQVLKSQD